MTEAEEQRVIEVRTYRLHPGSGAEFDRLFREEATPLLDRWGITVLWHGPSLDDPDSYLLVRAFGSTAEREIAEDDFYGSPEWRDGPREPVLSLIESYHTVVVPAGAW